MFKDYKTAVLNFYLEMKEKRFLDSDMEDPGREKLRNRCLLMFSKKNSKKDNDLIQMFFDPKNEYNDSIRSIEKYDLDKFRPLVDFLKKGKNVREDKNVKLLAWLLNCPSYDDWRHGAVFPLIKASDDYRQLVDDSEKTKTSEHENPINTEKEKIETQSDKEETKTHRIKIWKNQNIRKSVYAFVAAFAAVGGSYFTWKLVDKQCMYWTGNEYKAIACDTKLPEATLVALDNNKVDHLKRITKRDTLTSYSIGKVFYGKINNKIEFYTDSGDNPQDNKKRLLPMTGYIFNKYILQLKR